jgi:methyl-accepting chemotaxis protein
MRMGTVVKKMMCWDYKQCGRDKDMSCPAFTLSAGRICWKVAGTMCGGQVQGTSAQKYGDCEKCDFYKKVKDGEI